MSFNREGVAWEQDNGAGWRYGVFVHEQTGDDEEWDVEVDYSHFAYVSPLASTAQEAFLSYPGANPGAYTVDNGPDVLHYDRMAAVYLAEQAKAERTRCFRF